MKGYQDQELVAKEAFSLSNGTVTGTHMHFQVILCYLQVFTIFFLVIISMYSIFYFVVTIVVKVFTTAGLAML